MTSLKLRSFNGRAKTQQIRREAKPRPSTGAQDRVDLLLIDIHDVPDANDLRFVFRPHACYKVSGPL